MRSALITGSRGFIGRHLTKALKKQQIKVIEFSRSTGKEVTRQTDWQNLPAVDVVFHLAAISGYKDCNADTRLAYKTNIGGTANALAYCRRTKAKLVFPSTYVYDAPYTEYKKETDPVKPTTHYAMTKWLGEELCRFYSRIFKVNTLILRTVNVYGPGQANIYLVPLIAAHLKNQQTLILPGPEIERSFIYIDDLIQAYMALAKSATAPAEIFNVSFPQSTTIAELIQTVEAVAGKNIKVKYSGAGRPNEINLNRLDISKLKQRLGWRPQTSLINGLKKLQRSDYF
jgi:UDP-glucose 4-epimerase